MKKDLKTMQDFRSVIGERIYWDDIGNRLMFLRMGVLEDVINQHNVVVDGDYKTKQYLVSKNVRTYPNGGGFRGMSEEEALECL